MKMRDSVCGKEIGEAATNAKVEMDGKTHYFCSASYAGKFLTATHPRQRNLLSAVLSKIFLSNCSSVWTECSYLCFTREYFYGSFNGHCRHYCSNHGSFCRNWEFTFSQNTQLAEKSDILSWHRIGNIYRRHRMALRLPPLIHQLSDALWTAILRANW